MKAKRKDVNGYLNGKKIAKNLLALALKENKTLDDVKKKLREYFPEIVFKVE
jgi:SPX domain protein involved in polyphosphate accumulation